MEDPENFFFEVDSTDPEFYFPGQTVTGRVVRIVTEPQESIMYFLLKFKGMAEVEWVTSQAHTSAGGDAQTYQPHRNQETYFDNTVQLNKQNDGTLITSIPKGHNAFPFIFDLPAEIPASYDYTDDKGHACSRIFYQAQATYRVEGDKSDIKAILNLTVERPLDLNFSPLSSQPNVLEGSKYVCCCCCRSGPISFKLTFNKTGFLVGEPIEFMAELINNTSKNIRRVEVWISRTVEFRAGDNFVRHDILEEQIGEEFCLPVVPSLQRIHVPISFNIIPNDYQPINSFGCSFMESTHQLHINMVIPSGVNLEGTIPIVIGVVPFVIPTGLGTPFVIPTRPGTPAVIPTGPGTPAVILTGPGTPAEFESAAASTMELME